MLKLFSKNTTNFLNMGLGILTDFVSNPIITETLNGEYNLEFKYLINGNLAEYLIEENIIEAKDNLFRIIYIKKDYDYIEILAKQIVFDLVNNFLIDVAPTQLNGVNALDWILKRTQYPHKFTCSGDNQNISSARYVRKNVIDSFFKLDNSLLKRFKGEFKFDRFNIEYLNKRGKNRNLIIRYGKNLTGIKYELDFETTTTRIMPVGKNGLLLPEKFVDSKYIDKYAFPHIKIVDLDIEVNENNTEIQAFEQMREKVKNIYETGIDLPKISVEVDFIELAKIQQYKQFSNLEIVELGDTVKIFIPKLNLNYDIRVIKTVYDCLEERYIKLELGSEIPNIVSKSKVDTNTLINKIESVDPTSLLEKAKNESTELILNALGGHVYKTNSELYIMDNEELPLARKIWRWNINGLGYSKTGVDGPYGIAITMDGKINADFITTGSLATDRITGLSQKLSIFNDLLTQNSEKLANISLSVDEINSKVQNISTFKDNITNITEIITSEETAPTEVIKLEFTSNLELFNQIYASNYEFASDETI